MSQRLNVLTMQKTKVLNSFIMLQRLSYVMSQKAKREFIILQELNKQFVTNSEFCSTRLAYIQVKPRLPQLAGSNGPLYTVEGQKPKSNSHIVQIQDAGLTYWLP